MYADDTTIHSTYNTFHETDNSDISAITHNINTERTLTHCYLAYTNQITYKHIKN